MAHAQGLGQQRPVAPSHRRPHLAVEGIKQDLPDLAADRMHVHMGISLVADQCRAVVDHGLGEVAVQIAGHGDRQVGRDGADAAQQLAFSVGQMLGYHGTVQIQHRRIAALGHRRADRVGHALVCVLQNRSRRHRLGRYWGDDFGACRLGQFQIGREGHAGSGIGGARLIAKISAPRFEACPIGHQGRKGVGFVFHHRNDDAHFGLRFGRLLSGCLISRGRLQYGTSDRQG